MNLTDEQKAIGKENFDRVVGQTLPRREFFKDLVGATIAGGAGAGAIYFGYDKTIGGKPLRVGIIGTGDEGNVLIGALDPKYVEVKAIADIRPYSIHRAFHGDWYSPSARKARKGLMDVYGYKTEDEARKAIKVYDENYEDLLADKDIEAVIIALPLWLHAEAAIKAMRAGKHVLTEKLMAWSVAQCKEMARVAEAEELLLATGHQRHYSILYDNAVDTIRRGIIGDIHHIRAQWHRGNLPGSDSWKPPLPVPFVDEEVMKNGLRAARKLGKAAETEWKQTNKLIDEYYAWKKRADDPKKYGIKKTSEIEEWEKKVAQKRAQLKDLVLADIVEKQYGYEADKDTYVEPRSALEELIRWRLWDRTGGGLMAELGSHQLDASGIFISSQFEAKDGKRAKVNPLSVTAVGGRHIFPHDRDVDDHVYCSYEYPGKEYYEDNDPKGGKGNVADPNKKVVVTYSSINGNGFGGYGEIVMGTEGTLVLEREQETMLYAGSKVDTKVSINDDDKLVDSYETGGYGSVAQEVVKDVSRGYTEEIQHWAWCIRNGRPADELHCHPKVALADAVIALTTNIAIKNQQRIKFNPDWFDPKSDATPEIEFGGKSETEGFKPRKASDIS